MMASSDTLYLDINYTVLPVNTNQSIRCYEEVNDVIVHVHVLCNALIQ